MLLWKLFDGDLTWNTIILKGHADIFQPLDDVGFVCWCVKPAYSALKRWTLLFAGLLSRWYL